MPPFDITDSPELFSETLFEKMKQVNPGIAEMDLYEFRYGLDNLYPKNGGWASVGTIDPKEIERQIETMEIFSGVQIKPRVENSIVLDEHIVRLANMLFVGLVTGVYPVEWIREHFYFDIRGFIFLVRTTYLTDAVKAHFGRAPYRCFEAKQRRFERSHEVGYKEFREANAELDQIFIDSVRRLIAKQGTPILIAIAGPTAAGKTEIVERLRRSLQEAGKGATSIEMDNFLTDRDEREAKGIGSLGKEAIHYDLFLSSLKAISRGEKIITPRYDFILATSSHTRDGMLKPGYRPVEVQPADIVFVEGNSPFLLKETADLIQIKVVYLTDDAVRLKRKWRRDIDYRKKYDPSYLRNRYFKEQYVTAHRCVIPQMELSDILVDTTGAMLWVTPEMRALIEA